MRAWPSAMLVALAVLAAACGAVSSAAGHKTGPPRVTTVVVTTAPSVPAAKRASEPEVQTRPTSGSVPPARPAALADVSHGYPFAPSDHSSYGGRHHDYPAADIFAACGTPVRSVVDGTVVEMSPTNRYDARVDDPATRGGIFVAVRGDDGVRYYMAHLRALAGSIAVGRRVARGDPIGEVGETGRASACHLHFSISPPCTTGEWWVRRGVVWPQPYLDSWRAGGNLSPVEQVRQFLADNPEACTSPGSMPWPST